MKKIILILIQILLYSNGINAQLFSLSHQDSINIDLGSCYADSTLNRLYIGRFNTGQFPSAFSFPFNGFGYYDFTNQTLDTIPDTKLPYGWSTSRIKKIDSLITIFGVGFVKDDLIGDTLANFQVKTDGVSWIPQPGGLSFQIASLNFNIYGEDAFRFNDTVFYTGNFNGIFNNFNDNLAASYVNGNWTTLGLVGASHTSSIIKYKSKLYVCGLFSTYNNQIDNIAVYDGVSWQQLGTDLSTGNAFPVDMIEYNGLLFIGGFFNTMNGENVVVYDGNNFIPISGISSGAVNRFQIYNGELYACGSFPPGGLAKWDGVNFIPILNSIMVNSMPTGAITDMSVYGNSLYLVGGFDELNGQPFNKIAEYRSPVSIQEQQYNQKLKVYPNPVKEAFTLFLPLNWKGKEITVEIINTNGKRVYLSKFNLLGNYLHINNFDLLDGIYVINVTDSKNKISDKIIVHN